jgi:hypothetical protein
MLGAVDHLVGARVRLYYAVYVQPLEHSQQRVRQRLAGLLVLATEPGPVRVLTSAPVSFRADPCVARRRW